MWNFESFRNGLCGIWFICKWLSTDLVHWCCLLCVIRSMHGTRGVPHGQDLPPSKWPSEIQTTRTLSSRNRCTLDLYRRVSIQGHWLKQHLPNLLHKQHSLQRVYSAVHVHSINSFILITSRNLESWNKMSILSISKMINFTENDHLVYSFISRQNAMMISFCFESCIVIKHWNINQELNHAPCKCCIFFLPTAVSIGTSVLQVKANDTDSTKSLQYSIDRLSIIAKSSDGTQITTFYPYDYRVSPC